MAFNLYPYQERAVERVFELKGRCGLFMEMGTGKTPVSIETFKRSGLMRKLVVAPLSVLGVWERQIKAMDFPCYVLNLAYGSLAERVQRLKQMLKSKGHKQRLFPAIILINYEVYWRDAIRTLLQSWEPEFISCDEAHKLKNRTTKQSRFAHRLTDLPSVKFCLALTGTPITNGIEDLFSVFRFINPNVFGRRYADFQLEYLIMGGFGGYAITGYRNPEKAERLVSANSFQIAKSDALDLPERTDIVVPIKLGETTRALYERFRRDAIAEVEGTDENGQPKTGVVLARIVLVAVLRLAQIANGFTRSVDDEYIDLSKEKIDAAKDIVEAAGEEQGVIFCRFVHDLDRLQKEIPNAAIISGDVAIKERNKRIESFQAGRIRWLLCQIQVASLGLDLTAGSVGIFYSTGYSLTDWLQARDRIHRHGQKKKVSYYHLIGEDTVDEPTLGALQDKQDVASSIVNLDYARAMLGASRTPATDIQALDGEAMLDALSIFGR